MKDTPGFERGSGILLHVTSLPGEYPVGDLGPQARYFVNFLKDTGQKYWQVLPLTPTSSAGGNSPYMSDSAFALNPIFVSPELLYEDGLISKDTLEAYRGSYSRVDYRAAYEYKGMALEEAARRALARRDQDYEAFCQDNTYWLDDYALFSVLKGRSGRPWYEWDEEVRRREETTLRRLRESLRDELELVKVKQYLLHKQWMALKGLANSSGISLVGDIPIYVSLDSSDVWVNQYMFKLDEEGRPYVVAGAPPDPFSDVGQLWGNPIYRWDVIEAEGFRWWKLRFKRTLELVDAVRIDHFRGFSQYWEVPAGEPTAVNGYWVDGPKERLFQAVEQELGRLKVIAEDLGVITPDVVELREKLGYPGMKVLVFAFDDMKPDNPYKPHNYTRDFVAYTGTHDTDTVMGWYSRAGSEVKEHVRKYLGKDMELNNWDFIRLALSSVAQVAMLPMQDVLGLGSDARMNLPNTPEGNWEWRFSWEMVNEHVAFALKELTELYGR